MQRVWTAASAEGLLILLFVGQLELAIFQEILKSASGVQNPDSVAALRTPRPGGPKHALKGIGIPAGFVQTVFSREFLGVGRPDGHQNKATLLAAAFFRGGSKEGDFTVWTFPMNRPQESHIQTDFFSFVFSRVGDDVFCRVLRVSRVEWGSQAGGQGEQG